MQSNYQPKQYKFSKALEDKSNYRSTQQTLVQNVLNNFVKQVSPVAQAFNYKNEIKACPSSPGFVSQRILNEQKQYQIPVGSFLERKGEKENQKQEMECPRKSFDLANDMRVRQDMAKLQTKIIELEDQNINQKIDLKLKDDQIAQLEQQLQNEISKEKQIEKDRNTQLDEIKHHLLNLQKQCEQQNQQLQQFQYIELEIEEWKEKFFNLNKQYHLAQEQLSRQNAELELARKKTEGVQQWQQMNVKSTLQKSVQK